MLSWIYKTTLFLFLFTLSTVALSLPLNWELPPGSDLEYERASGEKVHQVLLSTPKRINNTLSIERDEKLKGERKNYLLKIDATSTSQQVFNHFRNLISDQGELLYVCEQRACGSSNYWANTILKERKLYGRDSDQYYLAAKAFEDGVERWLTVYAVKNGRKQHYVLVSQIKTNGKGLEVGMNGAVVDLMPLAQDKSDVIKRFLAESVDHLIWIVASIPSQPGDSYSELKADSEKAVAKFKQDFVRINQLPADRVRTLAGGGLMNGSQEISSEIVYKLYLLAP